MKGWDISELARAMGQMIRLGTIDSLDLSDATQPRCVVINGSWFTDSIPWVQLRAGEDAESWIPSIGEQAIVFSPFGDPSQAVAIVGINSAVFPSPGMNEDQHVRTYKDGASIVYDRAAHTYTHQIPDAGTFVWKVGNSTLTMTSEGTVLQSPTFEHNGETATFDGAAIVKQLFTYMNGIAGNAGSSGGANKIVGGFNVTEGDITTDGDVKAGDISLTGHKHNEVQQGGDLSGIPVVG